MSAIIGNSFEELDSLEMMNISGGSGWLVVSAATIWSTAPCVVGASIGAGISAIMRP